MSEPAAIWMFLSIVAICITWYKISKVQQKEPATPAKEMMFLTNGKPVNGNLELTVDGRTSCFKLVDGKIV